MTALPHVPRYPIETLPSRPFEESGFVYGAGRGLPYIGTASLTNPGWAYNPVHLNYPQPPPSAWTHGPYGPLTNPAGSSSIVGLCRDEILLNNVCEGNLSCMAGVRFQAAPLSIRDLAKDVDPYQFDIGRALQRSCVSTQVGSWVNQVEVD